MSALIADQLVSLYAAVQSNNDPDLTSAFQALQSDEAVEVWHAIRILGAAQRGEPELYGLLSDDERVARLGEEVGLVLASALGKFGPRGLTAHAALLAEGGATTRRIFVDALGEARTPEVLSLLRRAFHDDEDEVALWAALGLAKAGEGAVGTIRELMSEGTAQHRAFYLFDALLKIGTPRAMEVADLLAHAPQLQTGEAQQLVRDLRDRIRASRPPSQVESP